MREINKFIVHCSATPNDSDISADDIRLWHTRDNGWSDIGYHFVICRDGELQIGRDIERAGAHVKGYNKDSIGVCLIGNDEFTERQFTTLRILYTALSSIYDIEPSGHRDWTDAKTCPNFEVKDYL